MTQYFQIVQNIDELKRLYPDLNMDSMQVVQVTGNDGTTQSRQQVVYQTGDQNTQPQTQQQQTTQYILQDDSTVHHQQQQQQLTQQHVYQQVQQDQRHQIQQQHHQQHQQQQQQPQQQMYYTSELHPNTTVVQHSNTAQQQQQQVQQQQHHVQTHQTHTSGQSTQQILYRMPVTQQQTTQQTQQILNNTHVIVQQSQPQVLIQASGQTLHQPDMLMRQQRLLFNPGRTVMYTSQDSVHQQHSNTVAALQQQPRLVPQPRPIVSATQQPSQNVIFHQVPSGQSVAIQQPQAIMASQVRSTIRAKIPRGNQSNRGMGIRAPAPMENSAIDPVKTTKPRATITTAQRGNRGGRNVRGRGGVTTPNRVSIGSGTMQPLNTTTNNTTNTNKLNQQNFQQQQSDYNTGGGLNSGMSTTVGTSVFGGGNAKLRTVAKAATSGNPNTAANTSGNYQSNNMDLEDSIQAVVVKKNQEQSQNVGNNTTGQTATTLTTYYAENESDDSRFVKTQNGTCMTLSEYKKRNPQALKVVQSGQRAQQQSTASPTNNAQKTQLSNAGQSALPSGVSRLSCSAKASAIAEQQQQQQQQQPMTLSSVQRTSHNNYEIQTQHVIQNRSIQQTQNYSEKDRNSAKMLVILASGEQRLITFTLPRESCTVQDLLEQVGVPFDDKTTIQCVESPGANIDFVVTVGFSVQESASELISKAEESIQMSRQQESATAAAAAAAAAALQGSQQVSMQRQMQTEAASSQTAVVATTGGAADDGNKEKSAEEPQRKVIQGYLAVCQYCGFCGYDHAKCERCKRVFLEEPKRIPSQKTAAAAASAAAAAANAAAAKAAEEEKKRPVSSAESLNRTQSKVISISSQSKVISISSQSKVISISSAATSTGNLPTPGRPTRSASSVRGRTRSGRTRPAEIEEVILSSDDDGDAVGDHSNKSSHKATGVSTTARKQYAFEPDLNAVDESQVYGDFHRENVVDAEAMDTLYTSFTCKIIRIGTHRFETKDAVTFTKRGIRILAPNCSNLTDIVPLYICKEEIVKIVAFFSKSFSVMFIYTMRKCAEYIRESLDMKPKTALETPYFNPAEKGDTYNKIILQIDSISEESINVIRSIYKSITLEEIQFQDANDFLLRAAAKDKYVVTPNTNEIHLDPNDIRQILIYPPGRGISINTEDYMCLAADQYLNDVILDFYLKWVHNNVIPENVRNRTHIFGQFFYKSLTRNSPRANANNVKLTAAQKRHARVASWTKNVNLFEKDFIVVPLNEMSHWFLAIICFPSLKGPVTFDTNEPINPQQLTKTKKGSEKKIPHQIGNTTITPLSKRDDSVILAEDDNIRDEAEADDSDLESDDSDYEPSSQRQAIKQPVILIFDSLMGASRSRIVATLRDYLTCEYQAKVPDHQGYTFTKNNMPGSCVKVPQQNNFTDCGLYVLQYVEKFFTDPCRDYTLPIKQWVNWFDTITVTRKREEISNLLIDLIRECNPSQLPLPKIPFPTLNGELIGEDQIEFEEDDMDDDGMVDDEAETQSSPEESTISRVIEKNNSSSTGNNSSLTLAALPAVTGRKIVLKRSFPSLTVNVRKTPKLDP